MSALRLRAFRVKCEALVGCGSSEDLQAHLRSMCRFHGWEPDGQEMVFVREFCGCVTVWPIDGPLPTTIVNPLTALTAQTRMLAERRAGAN